MKFDKDVWPWLCEAYPAVHDGRVAFEDKEFCEVSRMLYTLGRFQGVCDAIREIASVEQKDAD